MNKTLNITFIGGVNVYMGDSFVNNDTELKELAKSFLKDMFKDYFSDINIGIQTRFEVIGVEIEEMPIMNTTNNHNEYLVIQINKAWNFDKRTRLMMESTIDLLMGRDKEECEEKGVGSSDYHDYLMHVADDKDLETILSFCRWEF